VCSGGQNAHRSTTKNHHSAGGGLSPVVSTSLVTVVVVVPSGVETVVSSVVDDFSEQPTIPMESIPNASIKQKTRFMFRPFV
jgi:hypothetical protein